MSRPTSPRILNNKPAYGKQVVLPKFNTALHNFGMLCAFGIIDLTSVRSRISAIRDIEGATAFKKFYN